MKEGDVLDGELYRHRADFNDLAGSIRNVSRSASMAQYYIYDAIDTTSPQAIRVKNFLGISETDNIKIVKTISAAHETNVY